jgi:glutamate dehydrogenase
VKAHDESHGEVRDRANDAIRADGREIRAKGLGEGGNLGCTQRGRVEYAQSGGRKGRRPHQHRLHRQLRGREHLRRRGEHQDPAGRRGAQGTLTRAARDKLLASMTDEVAALVLRNNYLQSQAISVLEQRAPERLSEYQSLIRTLERGGHLNRAIEFLPADDEFAERRKQSLGLSRPELAVGAGLQQDLAEQSPARFGLARRSLLRERSATLFPLARAQTLFARDSSPSAAPRNHRDRHDQQPGESHGPGVRGARPGRHGADPAAIARAYSIAREIFSMRSLWADIESLDNSVVANVQYSMLYRTGRLLHHTSYWLLREHGKDLRVENAVRELRAGVEQLTGSADLGIGGESQVQQETIMAELTAGGVPEKLARRVARLALLEPALDIVALSRNERVAVADVARVYFELGVTLGLDWLHGEIDRLVIDGPWQASARTGLRDAAMHAHRQLTQQVLRTRGATRQRSRGALERAASRARSRLEAHAHRNAARGPRTLPRSPWASTRSAACEGLDAGAPRAGDHHLRAPDALAAVLDSVSRQTLRRRRS